MESILDSKHTDPRLIPLPPSPPPPKPFLPARRPVGWVSSLPERILSSASDLSAPRQASAGGRSISGTLLRAVALPDDPALPLPSAQTSRQAKRSLRGFGDLDEPDDTDGDTTVRILHDSEGAEPGDDSEEELLLDRADLSAQVAALTDQEKDEVWMSYVRAQLAALFPDLSSSEPIVDLLNDPTYGSDSISNHVLRPSSSPYIPSGAQGRSVSGSTAESAPVRTPRSPSGSSGLDTSLSREPGRNTGLGISGELGWLQATPTTMRGELEELREEIQMLRGVVGGLAEGLGGRARQDEMEAVGQGRAGTAGPTGAEVGEAESGETAAGGPILSEEVGFGFAMISAELTLHSYSARRWTSSVCSTLCNMAESEESPIVGKTMSFSRNRTCMASRSWSGS